MEQTWIVRDGDVRRHAVIVDDDPAVLAFVAKLLERSGYRPLVATSAESAVDLLDRHAGIIELLVTDVELPGMQGSDLADLAQARWPRLAVVLMSGAGRGYLLRRGAIRPEAMVLTKPFLAMELLDIVSRALRDAEMRARRTVSGTMAAVPLEKDRAAGDDDD
jgi:two-component system cell cycle sensor histidine kinase/response regulator CckA